MSDAIDKLYRDVVSKKDDKMLIFLYREMGHVDSGKQLKARIKQLESELIDVTNWSNKIESYDELLKLLYYMGDYEKSAFFPKEENYGKKRRT